VATHGAIVAHMCRVVRFFPCKVVYRFESLRHPRKWVMACSPCSNIIISTLYYCDDNYMDDVDYFVVMVYDDQYCFDTFACLD
jgi:hypothetical protein